MNRCCASGELINKVMSLLHYGTAPGHDFKVFSYWQKLHNHVRQPGHTAEVSISARAVGLCRCVGVHGCAAEPPQWTLFDVSGVKASR